MCHTPLTHFSNSRISSGDFDNTLQTLLRALQTSLLQTYKSKFTQVREHSQLQAKNRS